MKMVKLDRVNLITRLAKRRMKVNECASKACVSRATLSGILSGKRCSEYTAAKIADAFDCELTELLECNNKEEEE